MAGSGIVGRICLAAALAALLAFAPPCAARLPEGASGAAALLFHEVAAEAEPGSPAVVSAAELARLLDALAAEGYVVVSPRDFLEWWEGRKVLPPRALVLCFDDGYAGVYENAFPVLRERGLAAFAFPVAKWFSPHPRPEPHRPHLTRGQALELLAAGWAFGGHTWDGHRRIGEGSWIARPLPGESPEEHRARAWADVRLAQSELADLGTRLEDFAPPYGDLTPELEALLREAGVKRIWVQEDRLNLPGQGRLARVEASSAEDALARLGALFGGR